ncbi:MAG: hypothetical protein A2231_05165 [Candidatus Firestonebacteria bacterium RIFOXYA2_FULL_40_8]|nr:MAG: hypothetical protein A2231_05165 [Candidatus Firestonebacteria bacterium RIFOXYA2_FULL_40_8]
MKRSILICLFVLFSSGLLFSKDVSEKKSMRALRMEKFASSQLDTLEIQINVGKCFLGEFDKNKPIEPSAEQIKKGYIVFLRNYLFDIRPFSNPTAAEINKKDLKIFASLGEYEPLVFGVNALTNLTGCKVTASEFLNEKGAKILPEAFQVNDVKYRPVGMDQVTVVSEILERAKEIARIDEGLSKMIWVNVKVPEDAKPGVYKGKLTFAPANKPATDIPVELTVLPIKLLQPPAEVFSCSPIMAGSWNWEEMEKEFAALKEHGCTGEVTSALAPEGENGDDFTNANKYMEMAKKAGMQGYFFLFNAHCQGTSKYDTTYGLGGEKGDRLWSQPTYDKLTKLIQKTEDNAIANKWLPHAYYLTTELGSTNSDPGGFDKTMKGAEGYYAAARKVKGAILLATFNRVEELAMHWKLPTLDWFGLNGEMCPDWEQGAKVKPTLMTFISADQRMGHGFYLWKYNIKAVRPWCLKLGVMDPREQGLLYYYNKESHPSVRFERIREAVDDYKYCYLLNETIKQAKAKGKDTKNAESVLQNVINKIPHDHKKDTPGFDLTSMDSLRLQLAEQIIKLQN